MPILLQKLDYILAFLLSRFVPLTLADLFSLADLTADFD